MAPSIISTEFLVLDTSCVLNVLAIEPSLARRILGALRCRIVVPGLVLKQEVLRHPRGSDLSAQEGLELLMKETLMWAREVVDQDGVVVFVGDCFEVVEWLRDGMPKAVRA